MAVRKTVRSRRLGRKIKGLRDRAGLSQDALAAKINDGQPAASQITQTHLSRVEAGSARISAAQLDRIIAAVGADDETAAQLRALHVRVDERGWWQDYSHLVTEIVEMAIELGEEAEKVQTYDAVFIQGLLQTPEYARTCIESSRAFVRPIDVEPLVSLRLRRQSRLTETGFDGLTAVLTEATLRHDVGGSAVMNAQLARLCEIIEEGRHAIHVLRYRDGPWPGMNGFVIYQYPDEEDAPAAYVDGDVGPRIYEDRETLNAVTFTFSAALTKAVSGRESLDFIHAVRKEMWSS